MIYLASDKHGYNAIQLVADFLSIKNIEFINIGVKNENEEVKLEDLIPAVVSQVKTSQENRAILSCGTGVGVEIGANKFSGIRASLATNEKIAEWSKVYDNTNVLCLVGWEVNKDNIEKIVDIWLKSEYDGNKDRLEMIKIFDTWH